MKDFFALFGIGILILFVDGIVSALIGFISDDDELIIPLVLNVILVVTFATVLVGIKLGIL